MKVHEIRFLPLLILALLCGILAQATHEGGHLAANLLFGNQPVWAFTRLVQLWEQTPNQPEEWVEKINADGTTSWLRLGDPIEGRAEEVSIAAAGPLLGLIGAALGIVMAGRVRNPSSARAWLAFAISLSLSAVLYYLRAPLRDGGDEFDMMSPFGLPKILAEIPFALAYLACLVLALRQLPVWRARWTWLGTILLGSALAGVAMSLVDPYVIAGVDAGSSWFSPVLGYALPVLVVNLLVLAGVWTLSRRAAMPQGQAGSPA